MKDLAEYAPLSYDNVPDSMRRNILSNVREMHEKIITARTNSRIAATKDLRQSYAEYANDMSHKLDGYIDALEDLDIFVRFNYLGHREEWAFITLEDVQRSENYDVD